MEPTMYYIDPHIHMVSRVTDDYERIARMGLRNRPDSSEQL